MQRTAGGVMTNSQYVYNEGSNVIQTHEHASDFKLSGV
jgi:hypothetical protein